MLPKPCGARPESVALPCALQVRVAGREVLLLNEAGGREALLLMEDCGRTLLELNEPVFRAPCCEYAEGGRFAESCDWRAPLKPDMVWFGRLKFPARFPAKLEEFMVRAGKCEAAAEGVERATTLRFCTACDGVATRPCMLEAPI